MKDHDHHPRDLLSQFAEGSLDRRRAARVADHIAACDACARETDRWGALILTLARLPRPEAPPGLRERVLEAIVREGTHRAAARIELGQRRLVAAFSWAYAAGVVVLAGFVLGLALAPGVRQAAGSALAMVSAAGLRAGLLVVDGLSTIAFGATALGRFLSDQMNWVGAVARAFETAGGAAGPSLAAWSAVVVAAIAFSAVFVRFLHQREPEREVPHVGPMLA